VSEVKHSPPDWKARSGFTLLELLVVIVLVSLTALLVFASMKNRERHKRVPDPLHIKEIPTHIPAGGLELVCTDQCRRCVLIDKARRAREVEGFGTEMDGYLLGPDGEERRVDFGRYGDRKVCLRFRYYENGSTSQLIVQWKGKYYFIPAWFGTVKTFRNLREAVEYWREKNRMLQSPGDYY